MLESKVGNSTISHSSLKHFLTDMGFTTLQFKTILKKYFSPTINAYVLKPFKDER